MSNNKFISIPNKLLCDSNKNNIKIFILSLIQFNMTIRGKCIFNIKWLLEKMNIKLNDSRRIKQIHNCVTELKDENILIFDGNTNKFNNTDLLFAEFVCDDNFVQISDYEFESIYNYSNQDVNVRDLLIQFAYIKSKIDDKGYCYPSIKLIADDLCLSEDTVTKYNNILSNELGLILIGNVGSRIFQNGSIKTANNLYAINDENGRSKLASKIKNYKNQLGDNNIKIAKNELRKEKQSIKMSMIHLKRKFEQGKLDEIEFSLKYCELNDRYEKLIKVDEELSCTN